MSTSIEELKAAVDSLREEVAQWKRVAMFRRQIDLIDFGAVRGFVYTDDLCYAQIHERYRHGDLRKPLEPAPAVPQSIAEAYDRETIPLLELLFCHYWMNGLEFALFDVGCQYGFGAISAAQRIRAYGKSNHVYAFDPGVAADLTPYNLILSGLSDRVTFERMAVSDAFRVAAVFTELGHSENNRIVNRTPGQEAISYPITAVSLDEYLRSKGIGGHPIVKIDTQGAEAEVLRGMQGLLGERYATIMTEFTPWALETSVDPAAWLAGVMNQFVAFDLHDLDPIVAVSHRAARVADGGLAEFVKRVDARPSRYTDLLLVDKRLPGCESLVARVASSI